MMVEPTRRTVLLIEDNPGDAAIVTEVLEAPDKWSEYRIHHVLSLGEAERALRGEPFDVVLLDLRLPDSTGVDSIKSVLAQVPAIPIVVLTGMDDDALAMACINAGAQDYVNKDDISATPLRRTIAYAIIRFREAQVVQLHRQFQQLVAVMPDAMIVTDRDGIIQFVNDAAQDLFGKRGVDFIGKPVGYDMTRNLTAEIVVVRGDEQRAAEMRVAACEWNNRPAFLAMIRDVTEREQLSEHLRQAQKMEAIGLLAGGIAHDFNNLLQVMLIYAEMIRAECAESDLRLPDIVEVIRAIERAQALTRQLLAFSRKQPVQPIVINLSEVVSGIHSMLRRTLPSDIEIVTLAVDHDWSVFADQGQIEQVIMNLAVNARDAMPGGGRFALEIENRVVERSDQSVVPGDYVSLRVTDTGCGIAPSQLGRVFEPFFTTKERGRGTGLGLATCYGIVKQAGGDISVHSEQGKGTSFTILLPRSHGAAEVTAPAQREAAGFGGPETILVVEDDMAVMRATVGILRNHGYNVLSATNGDEASRVLERDSERIKLVLSDMVMPQLSGPELSKIIVARWPNLPLIFMTGYSERPAFQQDDDLLIEDRRALMKPFRARDLLRVVRQTLDEAQSGAGADAGSHDPRSLRSPVFRRSHQA